VKAADEQAAKGSWTKLQCGGFEITGVEPGNWTVIDTEAWSQLDEANTRRLKERFGECGLQHLLVALLKCPSRD
jgi:hypothetical protein